MISLVKKYLSINKFSNQQESFEDLFLSHPNYPSVFAITDSFDTLAIENIAIKVPKEQLPELPECFLAFFEDDLVLVHKETATIKLESTNGDKKTVSFNTFLDKWNGVIIAIEINTNPALQSENKNNKWLYYTLPFLLLTGLSIFYNHYSLNNLLLLLTSGIGLLLSVFIVQEKFGVKNEMVSKLCSLNTNTSCDSVIKSNTSVINKWVHFSDLPLIFFSINFLSILRQPEQVSWLIGLISILSVPMVVYSIWLQKFELKKWCVLCLAISSIMVFQGLSFVFSNPSFSSFSMLNLSSYLFASILVISAWFFVKPVLEAKIKTEKEVLELKKFKRNYDVFNFLNKDVPMIKGFHQLEGIQFGQASADVQLTVIVSPSCGHCHTAFKDAFELYSKFPEQVYVNVLFNINPQNDDNAYKSVVENLLAINKYDSEKAKEAIIDWHINKVSLDLWKKKWNGNNIGMDVHQQIHQQYNWCFENEFNYTPVKIINEKLLPNEYQITELKYFLNNFSKENQTDEDTVLAQA